MSEQILSVAYSYRTSASHFETWAQMQEIAVNFTAVLSIALVVIGIGL
jgi:hypothetical protein